MMHNTSFYDPISTTKQQRDFLLAVCRLLVGILFIFSGLIKANDPTGFGYKLQEYFHCL
ncbi:hypothetical protein [Sphingobacterium sp. T2]|uniref:hypothetical protein n=1 Tax=Sphingobacterium sp. T2 TaxID=1590596 RepID=UPI00293475CC|nr:hypothetical protein [Sphingobacterium sp. T2]